MSSSRYTLRSVGRALELLSCFAADTREWGINDLSRSLGLPRSAVHRLLLTLREWGYIEQDPISRKYRLGLRAVELGRAALARQDLRSVALPVMRELARRSRENVNLAVLDGMEIVYLERLESQQILRVALHPGARLPAHCTAMGKVLLASLPEEQLDRLLATSVLQRYTPKTVTDPDRLKQELRIVRRQGYAMADEELAIGVRSVAAPIRNREGEVVAAMNITGPTVRFKGRRIGELRRMVIEGARRISALLGYGESPTTGSGEEADEGG
mgnify:CR=1 FL=1|jgi:PcaR/PcaU/PobR family beta-ketoadipate pathway transcriptional regulator